MAFAQLQRCKLRIPTRLLLVLNVLFASLLLTLCVAVTLNQPVHKIAWLAIVVPTAVFALLTSASRKGSSLWSLLPTLIVMMLGIALVSGRAIRKHDFISTSPDTWAYCSFAEYLEHNPRTAYSHLPPVEQFGSHLRNTRFGTASLLAFFAAITGGNPATALVWLTVLASANIFLGFTAWCRVLECPPALSLGAGFFAVACSWVRDAISVGNLDNLLFIAILPHFLTRFLLFTRGPKKTRSLLMLALTSAALFYVYPEGTVISGALFLPFLAWRVVDDLIKRRQVKAYIFLIIAAFVLATPYIGIFFSFLVNQVSMAGAGVLPGANFFPGLLSPALLPAIFGLAQEFNGTTFSILNSLLPLLLILLITVAAFFWWRTNRSLFFCLPSLILFAAWQGVFQKYDYGLFKTLFIGSAYWVPAIFVGLNVSGGRLFARRWREFRTYIVVLLTAWAFCEKRENFDSLPINDEVSMKPYQQLSQIRDLVGKEGIILKIRSAFDQEWAVFFLRDVPLKIPTPQGYMTMPHILPVMAQAEYADGEPNFALSDIRSHHAIWQNQKFRLVPRDKSVSYEFVDGPNQVERVRGKRFVWIGSNPTSFTVESPSRQVIWFYALQGWLGPSLPNAPTRTIVVNTDNFRKSIVTTGVFSVEFPVEPGKSRVEVWCEDKPSATVPGDPRVLLFGLWDFQFEAFDDKN